METKIEIGQVVKVGPAYSMDTRARTLVDEVTGYVGTVVCILPNGDLGLVHGDQRAAVLDASDWQMSVSAGRCEAVNRGRSMETKKIDYDPMIEIRANDRMIDALRWVAQEARAVVLTGTELPRGSRLREALKQMDKVTECLDQERTLGLGYEGLGYEEPFCACGRRWSDCDGSRAKCHKRGRGR